MTYREYRSPVGLEPLVACLWASDPVPGRTTRVIPDGCVDLVWFGAEQGLVVVGADTGPWISGPSAAGDSTYAIRLRPGAAGAVLGLPASEVRDSRVSADLVWGAEGRELEDALMTADPGQRLRILTEGVLRRHATPDPLALAAARKLAEPGVRVSAAAADLGISERQLNRRLQNAVGYGPKMLARVARLRRLIAQPGDDPLAIRAFAAGYASQAHMTDEVRRLTGLTPVHFLKDAALTAA
ncbi:helix-turn-helix domain-containing protein [Kribbella sp. ALI-6-A]|uniref:helix-turn-helix domain-containing protein n=1 Tax=Kribbella sp. ALI-6-A TaxID=1933817 RepID=UPI00192CF833|nr:helix-turn-helix domain-containing protein [Kribbella sp. ALI-6-A]